MAVLDHQSDRLTTGKVKHGGKAMIRRCRAETIEGEPE
jgi:hypothetical protein